MRLRGAMRAGVIVLLCLGGRSVRGDEPVPLAPGVRGLVFFGFPLHPAGAPASTRAEHLTRVSVPMLFLQGTRDTLADLGLLRPVLERIGGRATLRVLEDADHSFHVRKKSGRTDEQMLDELADSIAGWRGERT